MFQLATLGELVDVRSGAHWSADELRRRIAVHRSALQQAGVVPGDLVIIAHGGTPYFFADLFAAWSLGACCACINAALTGGELETVTRFVEPRVLLMRQDAGLPAEPDGVTILDAGTSGQPAELPEHCPLDAQDAALILFTSGTTGNPKGVVHSAGSLAARAALNRQHIGADTLRNTLCVLPTHFGHGLIGNCLTPLLSGARLYLYPAPGIQGLSAIGSILEDNAISFMSSVPAFWKMVTRMVRPPAQQTLHQVHIGSAPLAAELWQSVIDWTGTDNVHNMYGITETANWAAGASAREYTPEDGLIGRMWGGRVALLDADGRHQLHGSGEILLSTPSLMTGYFRRDDLTAEVLRDGWYHTGDRGAVDDSGTIRLLGRLKTEINRAGTKIQPEEIDLLLERHPAVAEACTFGMPDPVNGERVAIAVQLSGSSGTDPSELKAWCAERIRMDCVPEKWFIVDEIPKTDRGKINRDRVRDVCLSN